MVVTALAIKDLSYFQKMSRCVAHIKKDNARCLSSVSCYGGLCGTHFNSKYSKEAGFKAEVDERIATLRATNELYREVMLSTVLRKIHRDWLASAATEVAAEQAAVVQAGRRAEKIAKRDRYIANAAQASPIKIIEHARKAMEIWQQNNVAGYDIPKAYVALCYKSSTLPGFANLITACVRLRFQAFGNHPDHAGYREVPQAERDEVITAIHAALAPYGDINEMDIVDTDPQRAPLQARKDQERRVVEIERLRAEEALLVAERAARNAQFQADLRERPVVFQRDPEGSINLRAFAADTQSVHRSSVQSATHKSVLAIISRPYPGGIETLAEIVAAFNDRKKVRWASAEGKEKSITELTNDYFNLEAFSVPYGDVLDRIWYFIREHEHHNTLVMRLAQEIAEGVLMCSNGKMARLINVLMGFDDTLEAEAPKELFQNRFAELTKLPSAERTTAAQALFSEFNIPEAEHAAWLEPLLEA